MTLLQSGLAANDPRFRLRVQAAIFAIAQAVIYEDPATDGHVPRMALANAVVRDPRAFTGGFAWLCASNPTIASSVTETADGEVDVACNDEDVTYVCSGSWNAVAGWLG